MIILWEDFKMFTISTENEKSLQANWAETMLIYELFHRRSLPKWQKPEQIRRIITQTNGLSLKCAAADARPVVPETAWMCVYHNSAGDSGFENKPAKNTWRRHLQMRSFSFSIRESKYF